MCDQHEEFHHHQGRCCQRQVTFSLDFSSLLAFPSSFSQFYPVSPSFTLRSRLSSRFTNGREGEGRIRDATRCHANARPAKYAINLALAWGHLCMCVCVCEKEKGFAVICLSEALTAFTYCAADALTLDTKANTTI